MPSVNKTGDIFRVQLKCGNGFPPPGKTSHACCAAAATACRSLRRGCGANLGANHWMLETPEVQKDAQQIQLARLKVGPCPRWGLLSLGFCQVAWELIQLQRRYSQLLDKQMLPKPGRVEDRFSRHWNHVKLQLLKQVELQFEAWLFRSLFVSMSLNMFERCF